MTIKIFLLASFLSISFLCTSQEIINTNLEKSSFLFVSNLEKQDFKLDKIYSGLNKITNSITGNNLTLPTLDDLRQGQAVINISNFGKSLKDLKIDARPNLEIETQRVMYSGNFINPFKSVILLSDK